MTVHPKQAGCFRNVLRHHRTLKPPICYANILILKNVLRCFTVTLGNAHPGLLLSSYGENITEQKSHLTSETKCFKEQSLGLA